MVTSNIETLFCSGKMYKPADLRNFAISQVWNLLKFDDIIVPKFLKNHIQVRDDYRRRGFIKNFEYSLIKKNGQTLPISATAVIFEDQNIVRTFTIFRDMT